MKKDELYYLLTNTTTAKKKLEISTATLAHILGVSVKSLESWFSHTHRPSELNMYKLHWFVYLVLEMGASVDMILHGYDIANMDYFSDPFGNIVHCEPWESDACANSFPCPGYNMSDSMISKKDMHDSCDYCDCSCMKPEFNDEKDDDICRLSTDIDITDEYAFLDHDLASLIADKDLLHSMDADEVCDVLDYELNLSDCTCQESLRRVSTLKELCEIYIHNSEDALDLFENDFCEAYIKVHDYNSFVKFLDTFISLSEFDERFSISKDNLKMKISSYTNPALKVVNTKEVKTLRAYKDYLVFTCEDGCVYELPNDKSFVITSSSAFNSPNHDFMIRVGDNYYALSFELR